MLAVYNNPPRQTVLELLVSGRLNDLDNVLLTHLLNVVTNGLPCCYYGKFYDEPYPLKNRCLASELRDGKVVCPFYNEGAFDRCNYENKTLEKNNLTIVI